MAGKLFDTNAVIAFQAGETAIVELFVASTVLVPAIAMGELYYGAYKSGRVSANLKVIDEFAESNRILVCDGATAKQYGRIKLGLKVKGRPIPENDLWIAAIALQHGLTLVTRDEHFKQVDGLSVETW
jgi:tRNA(fMet)-specific endonuclease VapC